MESTAIKECLSRVLPFYSSVLAVVNVRCRLVKVNLPFQFSSHMTLMKTREQFRQVQNPLCPWNQRLKDTSRNHLTPD
jgi:hypothetical protein